MHVIIHGYIVIVLDAKRYIHVYMFNIDQHIPPLVMWWTMIKFFIVDSMTISPQIIYYHPRNLALDH